MEKKFEHEMDTRIARVVGEPMISLLNPSPLNPKLLNPKTLHPKHLNP